jgi:hypothetical protein
MYKYPKNILICLPDAWKVVGPEVNTDEDTQLYVYVSTSELRAKYCKRHRGVKLFGNIAKLKYFRPIVTKKLRVEWGILTRQLKNFTFSSHI